jgi:plasmid stability protein
MSIQITIRNVPREVRDELAARAARRGQSMQEYLRHEIQRMASAPTSEDLLEKIRQRKSRTGTRIEPADVVAARDADRR